PPLPVEIYRTWGRTSARTSALPPFGKTRTRGVRGPVNFRPAPATPRNVTFLGNYLGIRTARTPAGDHRKGLVFQFLFTAPVRGANFGMNGADRRHCAGVELVCAQRRTNLSVRRRSAEENLELGEVRTWFDGVVTQGRNLSAAPTRTWN